MSDPAPGSPEWWAALSPEDAAQRRRNMMVVSPFQASAALAQAGLLSSVEAALAQADERTRLAWSRATEFRRMSPLVLNMAASLGLTDEQLDALFERASTIEA